MKTLFAQKLNLKNKTIVLVDTHAINYSLIKNLLAESQVNLIWETNWKKSIDLCKENKTIDLVLIDIELHNMNGIETIRQLFETGIELPVIGLIDNDLNQNFKNKGLIKFITKPIVASEFIQEIELLFSENSNNNTAK